jgi:hypothetical protein
VCFRPGLADGLDAQILTLVSQTSIPMCCVFGLRIFFEMIAHDSGQKSAQSFFDFIIHIMALTNSGL